MCSRCGCGCSWFKWGNNRQGHPPDQRVWPTPWERKEFGPKRSVTGALVWWLPVGALHGRSFLVLYYYIIFTLFLSAFQPVKDESGALPVPNEEIFWISEILGRPCINSTSFSKYDLSLSQRSEFLRLPGWPWFSHSTSG